MMQPGRDEDVVQCDENADDVLVACSAACAAKRHDAGAGTPICRPSVLPGTEQEASMSYYNPHRRAGLSGSVTLFMLVMMLAAAASGSIGPRERANAFAVTGPAAPATRWSADDIRQLIAAIEQSEKSGFEARRYGLAALQSELEQTTDLWGRTGTRQLDALANTSALALANDHRYRAGLAPVAARDVNAVLAEGNLQSWLMAQGD
jgi:hypothetical protein